MEYPIYSDSDGGPDEGPYTDDPDDVRYTLTVRGHRALLARKAFTGFGPCAGPDGRRSYDEGPRTVRALTLNLAN